MRVTKLDMARQIVAALWNLPTLPTEGARYEEAERLARRVKLAELEPQWMAAHKILLSRATDGA